MNRDITVKVKLTVEEYLALKMIAEDTGHTQSSLARWLIKKEIRRFHAEDMAQQSLFINKPGPVVAPSKKAKR